MPKEYIEEYIDDIVLREPGGWQYATTVGPARRLS